MIKKSNKVNDLERMFTQPKLVESIHLSDWQIMTDDGWVDIEEVHKTVKYKEFHIETENGKHLYGADIHRIYNESYEPIFIMQAEVGTPIITDEGISPIVKKELTGKEDYMYDFTLADGSEHRFYANGILSHNSTNMGIRTILLCNLLPGIKIGTIVPRADQLKTIADKYSETDKAFRFKKSNSKFRDNLYYKEFPHQSGKISIMRLWYILTNADKIRGNTYDFLDFDEYQDFDDTLEPVIKQTQARSDLRSVTYSGTSKTTDSALETKWLGSARGLWRMTCPHCHFDNYPTIAHGVMDMIQPQGLCCKKCGKLLNVREGCWDFEAPELLRTGQWGFHVPQVIIPANTENKNIWVDIYRSSKTMEKKPFFEEFLGEATEEGSKELTIKDLQRICVLGSINNVQKEALDPKSRRYRYFIGGVDWGGSDYNPATKTKESYTVHSIIGVLPDGTMDLVYARMYAGMNYDDISQNIAKVHHQFKCFAIGGDFGGSAVYVNELKKLVDPLKVVSFKYAGPNTAYVSIPPSSLNFGNLYNLNRTESLTSLIFDIKDCKIRCPSWEFSNTYLQHCLHLVRVPSEAATGANTFLYQKSGNKPDDFMHSLNFAMTLAKLIIGQPLFEDPAKQAMFTNYMRYGQFNVPISHRNIARPISG